MATSPPPAPAQSHHGRSRTLTLIVLQEPVRPHVPHLHRVVHACGGNARATGVEVHGGDKAGKMGHHTLEEDCPGSEQTPKHPALSHPRTSAQAVPQTRKTSLLPRFFTRWPRDSKERVRTAASSDQKWTHQGANTSSHF